MSRGANFDLKDDGTGDIQLNLDYLKNRQCLWVFIRSVEEVESPGTVAIASIR